MLFDLKAVTAGAIAVSSFAFRCDLAPGEYFISLELTTNAGYERYSWTGSNRVGMTVTSVQDGPYVHIAGVSLGGSQAMFFKVNTLGEQNFLNTLDAAIDQWIAQHPQG